MEYISRRLNGVNVQGRQWATGVGSRPAPAEACTPRTTTVRAAGGARAAPRDRRRRRAPGLGVAIWAGADCQVGLPTAVHQDVSPRIQFLVDLW